jgi:hypothetical protein
MAGAGDAAGAAAGIEGGVAPGDVAVDEVTAVSSAAPSLGILMRIVLLAARVAAVSAGALVAGDVGAAVAGPDEVVGESPPG